MRPRYGTNTTGARNDDARDAAPKSGGMFVPQEKTQEKGRLQEKEEEGKLVSQKKAQAIPMLENKAPEEAEDQESLFLLLPDVSLQKSEESGYRNCHRGR